jgi:hypothetical protein
VAERVCDVWQKYFSRKRKINYYLDQKLTTEEF